MRGGDHAGARVQYVDVGGSTHLFTTADACGNALVVLRLGTCQHWAMPCPGFSRREAATTVDLGQLQQFGKIETHDMRACTFEAFYGAVECLGDDVVAKAFNRAVERLERAGAHIVRFDFPELLQLPEINGGGGLTAAEAWAWHRPVLARAEAQYDQRVAARIRRGEQMGAAAYIDVLDARARMIAAAHKRLGNFDAWLMPTVAIVPPEVAPLEADDAQFFRTNALTLRNPSVINFLDGCALTLPIHASGELPVGLSLCGLANDDARILRVGRAVEAALR